MRDAIDGPGAMVVHLWYTSANFHQGRHRLREIRPFITFGRFYNDVPEAASTHHTFYTILASF